MLSEGGIHNILSFKTTGLLIPLGKTVLNGTLATSSVKGFGNNTKTLAALHLAILQLLCATGNLRDEVITHRTNNLNWPTACNKRIARPTSSVLLTCD